MGTMTVLALIAFVMIAAPIAKGIGERIAQQGRHPPVDNEVRRDMELLHGQLTETQNRLAAAESRLDFYEKLLEERRPPSLPPTRSTDETP